MAATLQELKQVEWSNTKLRGSEDFSIWKSRITVFLKTRDAYRACTESDSANEAGANENAKNAARIRGDKIAMNVLISSVSDELIFELAEKNTAQEMWSSILNRFLKKDTATLHHLRQQFATTKMKETDDLEAHLNKLGELKFQIQGQLEGMNDDDKKKYVISDSEHIHYLLESLPKTQLWEAVSVTMRGNKQYDTMEAVKVKLRYENQRMATIKTEITSDNNNNEKVLNVNRQDKWRNKKNPKKTNRPFKHDNNNTPPRHCFRCHSTKHMLRDCPKPDTRTDDEKRAATERRKNRQNDPNFRCYMISAINTKTSVGTFILDSGSPSHFINDLSLLHEVESPKEGFSFQSFTNNFTCPARGKLKLQFGDAQPFILSQVYYKPGHSSILSELRLEDSGVVFETDPPRSRSARDSRDGKLLFTANRQASTHYQVSFKCEQLLPKDQTVLYMKDAKPENKAAVAHCRLGHPGVETLKQIIADDTYEFGQFKNCEQDIDKLFCETCVLGKLTKMPFPGTEKPRATTPYEKLHLDLWQSNVASKGRAVYALQIRDEFTKMISVKILKNKSDAPAQIKNFIAAVSNQYNSVVKGVQTDGGGELVSNEMKEFYASKGITLQWTPAHTPELNGIAEAGNKTVINMTRTLLLASKLPSHMWAEAAQTAAYLINRLPTRILGGKSPMEMLTGRKPNLAHLRTFGAWAYALNKGYKNKLDPRAAKYVLVGYSENQHGYRLAELEGQRITGKIIISRDCVFDETDVAMASASGIKPTPTTTPDKWTATNTNPDSLSGSTQAQNADTITPSPIPAAQPAKSEQTSPLTTPVPEHQQNAESTPAIPPPPQENTEESPPATTSDPAPPSRVFRSNRGVRQPYFATDGNENTLSGSVLLVDGLKTNLHLSDEEIRADPRWVAARKKETDALMQHGTWVEVELEDIPPDTKILSHIWTDIIKAKPDGTAVHKSRLCVRGDQQTEDTYSEIYSPVVNHAVTKLLFSIAAARNMKLLAMDVSAAYTQADLDRPIYMHSPTERGKIVLLRRALYGLKQSARLWNTRLDQVLSANNWSRSKIDDCLYFKSDRGVLSILVIYVDDVILATESQEVLDATKDLMESTFTMSSIKIPDTFLGVQVTLCKEGILLHQTDYVKRVLRHFKFDDAHPTATPSSITRLHKRTPDESVTNQAQYRSILGCLQFLAVQTRPDIAAATNAAAAYASDPSSIHLQALKRILRYLRGSSSMGLLFKWNQPLQLRGVTDSDWAGDTDTRRSTSGGLIYLTSAPILWWSTRQPITASSSTEAEYRAAHVCATNISWICQGLDDVGLTPDLPITVYEDNNSTIAIANSNNFTSKLKHIDVSIHLLKDYVAEGWIKFEHRPTNEMEADALTKPLSEELFVTHRTAMGMVSADSVSVSISV